MKYAVVHLKTNEVLYEAKSLEEALAWLRIELAENSSLSEDDLEIRPQ